MTWFFVFVLILACIVLMAAHEDRRTIINLVIIGLISSALKFYMISLLPQHADNPIDSKLYESNAEAIYWHDRGMDVDAYDYQLQGFMNHHATDAKREWRPDDGLSYYDVLGSSEWLYVRILAWHVSVFGDGWRLWGVITNIILAGLLPALTWLIARELGVSPIGRMLGALAMMLDPAVAVNSSWLLKDAFATFLMAIAILACARFTSTSSKSMLLVLVSALAALAMVRFVGYLALVSSIFATLVLADKKQKSITMLAMIVVSAAIVFHFIYRAPNTLPKDLVSSNNAGVIVSQIRAPLRPQMADQNSKAYDPAVFNWRKRLDDYPVRALRDSAIRTILAPYLWDLRPWRMTWKRHTELHALGSLVWLPALPFIAIGFVAIAKRRGFFDYLIIFAIGALVLAYTVVMGEWSTRQRAFMNPVFFALFGLGITVAIEKLKKFRSE